MYWVTKGLLRTCKRVKKLEWRFMRKSFSLIHLEIEHVSRTWGIKVNYMCRLGWVICINSICPTSKKWDLGMKINFPKYRHNIRRSPPSVFELRLLQWGPKMKFSLHNCYIFNSKTDGGDLQILSRYFGKLIFMPKTCFLEVGLIMRTVNANDPPHECV